MRQHGVALAAVSLAMLSACTTRPAQLQFPEDENSTRQQEIAEQTRQIVSHPNSNPADYVTAKRTLVEASSRSKRQVGGVTGMANCDVSRSGAENDTECVKAVTSTEELPADASVIVEIPEVRQQ